MKTSNNSDVVAYIIHEETAVTPDSKIIKNKPDSVITEATLQDFEENRNKKIYSRSVLEEALKAEHITEMIKRKAWYGECGHPFSDDIRRQMTIERTNSSHRILSYSLTDSGVKGIIETSMFPMGIATRDEIRNGAQIAYSMRGIGKVIKKGNRTEVGALKLLTYDSVSYPSHKSAFQTEILKEQVEKVSLKNEKKLIPIKEEAVIDFISNNSDKFKILNDNIGIESSSNFFINFINENFVNLMIDGEKGKFLLSLEKNINYNKDFINYMSEIGKS